jgi:hypothetical protein
MKLFIVTAKARGVSLAPNIGQMAYVFVPVPGFAPIRSFTIGMVELTGIEPVTSCLQSRRSPN